VLKIPIENAVVLGTLLPDKAEPNAAVNLKSQNCNIPFKP
tara:strand:+ start:291 stop:410 length:120 start_codon:yes stop_codon:yes gene_type:complete